MQAVKDKLHDMSALRKAKAEAKAEEKAEKEIAKTRMDVAHEVRLAREAEAQMELHVAKAEQRVQREIAKHELDDSKMDNNASQNHNINTDDNLNNYGSQNYNASNHGAGYTPQDDNYYYYGAGAGTGTINNNVPTTKLTGPPADATANKPAASFPHNKCL